MAEPWYCHWANKDESPSDIELAKWTLSRWTRRRARDIQEALADANHTIALVGEKDEIINMVRAIESDVLRHLVDSFPVDVPTIPEYAPKMVNRKWLYDRIKQLEVMRERCATFGYWKKEYKEDMNKAVHNVNKAIGRYQTLSSEDWRGAVEGLQAYVFSLESMQLLMNVGYNEQGLNEWGGAAARLGKQVRSSLKGIHNHLLNETMLRFPSLEVRPWKIDMGVDIMTWDEFINTPYEYWDKDQSGPPFLKSGPIFDRGSTIGFEKLCHERRDELDQMIEEFHAGRFNVVKGLIRRERKVWGRAIISIAQFRRWKLPPFYVEDEVL